VVPLGAPEMLRQANDFPCASVFFVMSCA